MRTHRRRATPFAVVAAAAALTVGILVPPAAASPAVAAPPQGTQSDAAFAASGVAHGVSTVSATTQRVSCYAPELPFFAGLGPSQGYPDGGGSRCDGAANTGEDLGPYATQDVVNPALRVKDHSESDLRIDPNDPNHLIGQSKWIVNGEGYNHLLGFYESFDGGASWPVQGHVPGFEGWADNTDPVGAFDPWGNFYSLVIGYQFYYDAKGNRRSDNGSRMPNKALPVGVVAIAVHPHATLPGHTPSASWITQHAGHLDEVASADSGTTHEPDKQWMTIDTNPASPHYGRVYAMWTNFVRNPSYIYESHADARPDGTHTAWSAPQVLPTVPGKPWETYVLPHVAPDGTIWTTTTNGPPAKGFSINDIDVVWSHDGGASWQGPLPVIHGLTFYVPFQNTTFREGIPDTFAVGTQKLAGHYPLYVAFEAPSGGLTRLRLTASFDDGRSWSAPIEVNDNQGPTEAFQPNLDVAPNGTVTVAFYDRRLPCPDQGTPEATIAGLAYDPGTAASPGTPYGRANYCLNTASQSYAPDLTPIGHNVRLSTDTWDGQLSGPHPGGINDPGTFIGDYFGITSAAGVTYTSSVSTANHAGENPSYHQQQIVARIATP